MIGKSKKYFLATCLIILIIASYESIFTVKIGEQVIVTQFGNVAKPPVNKPGLYLIIPFIQKVHYLPNHRIFELSTMISGQFGSYKVMSLEQRIQYKIGDPLKYFINFGNSLRNKEHIIQALKASIISELNDSDVFKIDYSTDNRKQVIRIKNGASSNILNRANNLLNPYGIKIVKLDIKGE